MKKDKSILIIISFLIIILFFKSSLQGAEESLPIPDPINPYLVSKKNFPEFELPAIQNEAERNYLGVSKNGDFTIGQIKAEILIIEFYSFYCPHCQRAAPDVNEVYQQIQNRPDIKEKIKIIGIGAGNSDYEISSFKNKYKVPFPLFPDKRMEIFRSLRLRVTPTFIGIKINKNGTLEQFYFREGGFEDSQKFLAEIIKFSGIEPGEKNEKANM